MSRFEKICWMWRYENSYLRHHADATVNFADIVMITLKQKAIIGIAWNVLSRVGQGGLGFLTTVLLARLLSPTDFGLLGMATVFTGFIGILQDFGLGPSIIQDQETSQEQLSGIFWFNFMATSLVAFLAIGSAPLLANFYGEPSITLITIALAVNFPLTALAMVHNALLVKQMAFKKLAIIQILANVVGGSVGITSAIMGLGVWALVWQQLISTVILVILSWLVINWGPQWTLSYSKIKKQLHFGFNFQIGSLFNYGTRNVDNLLVGKFIGPEALGGYQMAYRIMLWPLQNVSQVVGQVMFPALSSIKDDPPRIKQIFLRAISAIALVTFPLVLGLWVVAPSAIPLVLGEKWLNIVPIFQILGILGINQSITTNGGWISLSQGRTDLRLKLQISSFIVYLLAFVVGLNWGVIGVATCYTITSLLLMPIYLQIVGKLVNMTFFDVVKAVAGIFFCALSMAGCVWSFMFLLPADWPYWGYLMVQVPLGIAVYGALIHYFSLQSYLEVKMLIAGRLAAYRIRFAGRGIIT